MVCVGEGFLIFPSRIVHPEQSDFACSTVQGNDWNAYKKKAEKVALTRGRLFQTCSAVSADPTASIVRFPDFSVKKYRAKTPYFVPHVNFEHLISRKQHCYLMLHTVKQFIKICKPECTSLLNDQKNYLLNRTQYNAGLGDEIDIAASRCQVNPTEDLEKRNDILWDMCGEDTNSPKFKDMFGANVRELGPINSFQMIMGHVTPSAPPLLPITPGGEHQDTKTWLSAIAHAEQFRLQATRHDLIPGTSTLLVNQQGMSSPMRWMAARQDLQLAMRGISSRKFLQKMGQTTQLLFGDVDEAFEIEYLFAKEENQFLRRLFAQTTEGKLACNKFMTLAMMFWSGCEFSTLKSNYGPQIKAFVDYLHGHDIHYSSVARFIAALEDEGLRKKVGTLVPSYFNLRVATKSSNSVTNWWGAINYCYCLHSSSLKEYAPKVLKRSIKRSFTSLSFPTEGFFVREWIHLIHQGLSSSDPEIYLETLYLIYMMRMALRSNTTAELYMTGLTLVFDRMSQLFTLHQWGIKAKNCQALLGDLPKFSKVKEEPDSPIKPYICAVWALKKIMQFREQIGVSHDYFLFDVHGNHITPDRWLNRVKCRLLNFQAQFAQIYPLIANIKIGGHTPRKTYANIATYFGFPKEEIRMILRNTSWNCIREHYLKNSRAYNSAKSWSSHILMREMTDGERSQAIDRFSTTLNAKQRLQWKLALEFQDTN